MRKFFINLAFGILGVLLVWLIIILIVKNDATEKNATVTSIGTIIGYTIRLTWDELKRKYKKDKD